MRPLSVWVTAVLLVVGSAPCVVEARQSDRPAWSITYSGGFGKGNRPDAFESALRRAGFGSTRACGQSENCTPGGYPFTDDAQGTGVISVRRSLTDQWHLRASTGSMTTGTTYGFRASGPRQDFVSIHEHVSTYGAMFGWNTDGDEFWLGAGPAWYSTSLIASEYSGEAKRTSTRFGALFGGGLSYPFARWFTIDGQVQYRMVGNSTPGAIELRDSTGATIGTIEPTAVSFTHVVILFGVGVRF